MSGRESRIAMAQPRWMRSEDETNRGLLTSLQATATVVFWRSGCPSTTGR
jgi:hypothetical protein